jgi:glycosyltransferase involved in cell wall biosynthesis
VKGLRTLLRAAEKVIRVDGEATFLVAGDGPMRETLERESAQLGGRFKLLGFHRLWADKYTIATWMRLYDV